MELSPIIKKINLKGDGHPFGFGLSPEADWRVILIVTILLTIAVSAVNVYIFMNVNNGETAVNDGGTAASSLNIEELKAIVSYYGEKAVQFEKIKVGVSAGADPSI